MYRNMTHPSCFLVASVAFLLASCAATARVTTAPVVLPAGDRTYHLVRSEPATTRDAAVEAAVHRQMQAHGWREAEEAATWRLEAAYSVRPVKIGGYSDASARAEAWVAEPLSRSWWSRGRSAHGLSVSLIGPGEGEQIYQVGAVVTAGAKNPETTLDALAERVAIELQSAP